MKHITALVLALSFSMGAQAAPPSTESIEKLLAVAQVGKMLETIRPQMNVMMKTMMDKAMQGTPVQAEEQKILDAFRDKAAAIVNEELSMAKLQPMYVEIYRANLSQEDIDGLIAFYQSPTGQVFLTKIPQIMQSVMSEMPKRMAPMAQKIEQAGKEMQAQLAARKTKEAPARRENLSLP
ncbi:MAG: DUF2059 domain-containing protein [Pseudomonadota bacterium]